MHTAQLPIFCPLRWRWRGGLYIFNLENYLEQREAACGRAVPPVLPRVLHCTNADAAEGVGAWVGVSSAGARKVLGRPFLNPLKAGQYTSMF